MSLTSLLLGVPGKLRKLRGQNAPKMPLPTLPAKISIDNGDTWAWDTKVWDCPVYTHSIVQPGLNNAVETRYEVVNLSGKGAVDGIWVSTQPTSILHIGASNVVEVQTWGIEVLLDGVDVAPSGWKHNCNGTGHIFHGVSPVIGGCESLLTGYGYDGSETNYTTRRIWSDIMRRASVPIPFNESLVVTLIHIETNSSTRNKTTCYVNAWLTE